MVESQHARRHITGEQRVRHAEIFVIVQHVEVFNHFGVGDVSLAVTGDLVEDGECVAHAAVGFFGDDVERFGFGGEALALRNVLQMAHHVGDAHAGEVEDLAATEDGGKDFVFLGGGEDEDGMGGRFLKRFQESVEGCLAEHVDLVDDEDFVFSDLWRNLHLLNETADVLDGVVGGSIEFVDIVGALFLKSLATFAFVTRFSLRRGMKTVDIFGEDAGAGGFPDASRSAEEIGVSEFATRYGVLQRGGQRTLPHHRIKGGRTILSR